jgi:squalene-hopene/tetraprenyl-beta-curcumene cyclase
LRSIQNRDGGFGGCADSPSTAEETGLALRALAMHGGSVGDDACRRAAEWLIEHQSADGSWNAAPIGFYFAVLWYHERMYPLAFALGGLGALARTAGGNAVSARHPEEETPHVELQR